MADINFNYKEGEAFPPAQIVSISPGFTDTQIIVTKPNWITITQDRPNNKIRVSLNNRVNDLPEGVRNFTLLIYEREIIEFGIPPDPYIYANILINTYTVQVNYTKRKPTTVNPNKLDFYHMIGNSTLPAAQGLGITSEDSYTISKDQPWISISRVSGTGNTNVIIGVNVQALVPGTYNGNVRVQDSLTTFTIPVSLVVDGELGTEDFLFATPSEIRLEHTRYGFLSSPRSVSVNASGSFSIEATSSWMNVSRSSGNQNTLSFDVELNDNVNALGIGVFVSEVVLVLGSITKKVKVEVDITPFIEDLFDPDKLYFTDDENTIRLVSSAEKTQLSVIVKASNQNQSYRFKYGIPFFKGISRTRVGGEIRKIIGKLPKNDLGELISKAYIPYTPSFTDLDITENKIFSDEILRGVPLKDIRFIKGITPPDAKLTNLPEKIYITKKGILSFSFLEQNSASPETITISGAIEKTISVQLERNDLYSVLIPLSDLEGLSTGDEFTMSVSGVETNIQIKPLGIDHCIVFWENIWGCWDTFECTGQIRSRNKYSYTSDEYRLNRNSLIKEILEIDTIGEFTIDTGWVYSQEEVRYLESMFISRNIWLLIDGRFIQVNTKNSSFDPYLTRRFKKSFKLTFEKTIR
ncbi:BACON domain-containing protein [Aquimarina algiphila]|uniref:BACON domain-containing protein n=1 Tax=Aquimarina algiphila TaxID=2047982 RepID=UPI00232B15DC|nr:hypothetical protein [Aquimarina algiphila]